MLRRGLQRIDRVLLDDARLSHRQVSRARLLHHRAVRPGFGEFLAWKWFGGGNKLRDEIYAKHGLVAVDCFCIGPETSGWFRKEIKSLDELKGLKMRFFGLGAQVMQKLGVSTQLLAAADIYPALERGVIDATEFSMPKMDIKLGFHQIAKFNYFPGWHQQVSCSEFLMNKAAYDALPAHYKAMIEVAGQAQVAVTYAETEAQQFDVMAEMRDKHKVQVKRWDDKALAAFEKAWLEVLAEESAKDPMFKKVADHYLDFRKKYAIWGDSQVHEADLPGQLSALAGAAACCAGPMRESSTPRTQAISVDARRSVRRASVPYRDLRPDAMPAERGRSGAREGHDERLAEAVGGPAPAARMDRAHLRLAAGRSWRA